MLLNIIFRCQESLVYFRSCDLENQPAFFLLLARRLLVFPMVFIAVNPPNIGPILAQYWESKETAQCPNTDFETAALLFASRFHGRNSLPVTCCSVKMFSILRLRIPIVSEIPDFGFQSQGFWSPCHKQNFYNSLFLRQKFLGFGNPDSLAWDDLQF